MAGNSTAVRHIGCSSRGGPGRTRTVGWPGSVIEFLKVLGPLTDPTAHGGSAADAFHVVCPTLPGFGFSGKPTAPGWTTQRTGRAWGTLMARLGYTRYVAQGGDWGSGVTHAMAQSETTHCAAVHVNLPLVAPSAAAMENLTEEEQLAGCPTYLMNPEMKATL